MKVIELIKKSADELLDEAFDIVSEIKSTKDTINLKIQLIALLEALRPKIQKWVPVSKDLPKERGRYLVTFLEGNIKHVGICDYQARNKQWNLTGCRSYWKVIAWQPIPEAYTEDET